MKYETRITRLTVAPEWEPIFSEQATSIEIQGEAAGEYVKITQINGEVLVTREEWPAIRDAVERMLSECIEEEK